MLPKLLDETLVFSPENRGVLNAFSASTRNWTLTGGLSRDRVSALTDANAAYVLSLSMF